MQRKINTRLLVTASAALLLAAHLVLAGASIVNKSNTFDEMGHLTAGYAYWVKNDFRLDPENGNLSHRWAALPAVFLRLAFPEDGYGPWVSGDVWETGKKFFYKMGNNMDQALFLGRMMVALLSTALGACVFFWTKSLCGAGGGLIALCLYVFCPAMLANGRLITSDTAAALFFGLSTATLWTVMHRLSWGTLTACALCVSGLFLSKMSGVLLFPIAGVMLAVRLVAGPGLCIQLGKKQREVKGVFRLCLVFCGVTVFLALATALALWTFYDFRYQAAPEAAGQKTFRAPWEPELARVGSLEPPIRFMAKHKLLPESYLYGFTHAMSRASARNAYMMGRYGDKGWKTFFPFAFLVKTPLSLFAFLILAAIALARLARPSQAYAWVPWIALFTVYWLFAIFSHINIGHRHLLPIYPPLFILAGAVNLWRSRFGKAAAMATSALLCMAVIECLAVFPHFLAFFNVAAGGPKAGYRLLADSSLDWGQDLPGLQKWIHDKGLDQPGQPPVYLSYFGTASPAHYGVMARYLPGYPPDKDMFLHFPEPLSPGWYAISATSLLDIYSRTMGSWPLGAEMVYRKSIFALYLYAKSLQSPQGKERFIQKVGGEKRLDEVLRGLDDLRKKRLCLLLRRREPDASVGYSILLYRISEQDLKTALLDPVIPMER